MNIKVRKNITLINSDDIFDVMQKVLCRENKIDRDKEHFWIIGLNLNEKLLFVELVCIGGVRSTTVEPMNVFRVAILKGAVKVILVHNHPSGGLRQSPDDENLTDRLIQVGKILAIEVSDHLIISPRSYLSFSDIGVMSKLEESTLWMPPFEIARKIKAEAAKIRKEADKLRKESVIAAEKKGINKGLKAGEKKGIIKGRKAGKKEGRSEGLKAGERKGEQKGLIKGVAIGLVKGLEQGRNQRLKIAKKMLKKGMSVKEISAITGLEPKTIKGL